MRSSAVPRRCAKAPMAWAPPSSRRRVKIVVPAALSGLAAAFIVAISRAVGETMVVAIAAGSGPRNFNSWGEAVNNLNFLNPFKAAETMTGHIVRISGGDLSYDSIDYNSIFAIALMLFLMTLVLNMISQGRPALPAGGIKMSAAMYAEQRSGTAAIRRERSSHAFVERRQRAGDSGTACSLAATVIGIVCAGRAAVQRHQQSFGYVAIQNKVDPDDRLAVDGR